MRMHKRCHRATIKAIRNTWSASREYPGPVLFLIFINDLPKILEHSASDIYADDTTIIAYVDYRSAPGALNQVLQADVGKVAQCTTDNKMVLNESKTKTMLVAGKRLHKKMHEQYPTHRSCKLSRTRASPVS